MNSEEKSLLIIEDDEGLLSQLKWHFDDFDTTIITASTVDEALSVAKIYQPMVILQDLGLPPDPDGVSEGFRCIEALQKTVPMAKIIVLTGKNDHANALKSIAMGAHDFYFKPVVTEQLDYVVEQAFRLYQLHAANINADNESQKNFEPLPGVITNDDSMHNVVRMIKKLAPSDITTSLIGESGTGKERMARAIHHHSKVSSGPFVAVNCAAIPENLIEAELFGHEKGAFTGAIANNIGKIERANNGTLFLDEIGDMPLLLQAKLLRFLQERNIERIGGKKEIKVNARVICATNKDLASMVKEQSFREDLFFRISEVTVNIPPLRDRGKDKLIVARYFLEQFSKESKTNLRFTENAIKAIGSYEWPGNVRELENCIKRSVVLAENNYITENDLNLNGLAESTSVIHLKAVRKEAESKAITAALEATKYNVSVTAKLLGVTRPTLYDMMKKYSLMPESSKEENS